MEKKFASDRPTLRRRMAVQIGLMVFCSLMIGAGAIVGINGLHDDMGVTVQGYRELRQLYEVGLEFAIARDALSAQQPDPAKALAALEAAQLKLAPSYEQDAGSGTVTWLDESDRDRCEAQIVAAISQLKVSSGAAAMPPIDDGLGKLAMLSGNIRTTLAHREQLAQQRHRQTLMLIAGLSAAMVIVAVAIGIRQYQSVVRPLDRLGAGVRRFAAGQLSERIAIGGVQEFAALADDFNFMAGQLQTTCRGLEEKIEARTRELSRSQRLASVGYLAAGVAHEINNPLSIITGYSERSMRLLDRGIDEATIGKTRNTIRIICEEAFRCKEITDRLLSLARPGAEHAGRLEIGPVVKDVVQTIGGLAEFADRRIVFEAAVDEDLCVVARDGEIRQVVMNLVLNALEADARQIAVRVQRADENVELSVSDNGKGMSAATLERIFEPFYTEKRGGKPGIGLGLSITHAIVQRYGGSISAQSDGRGCGSRFVVRLPAAMEGACA